MPFFKKKKLKECDILNIAMKLSLEWGENWLSPIDQRLKHQVPSMEINDAKKLDVYIREVREDIFKIIEQHYLKILTEDEAKKIIRDKYPFLNNSNYKTLYNQGMYYAWRDNG